MPSRVYRTFLNDRLKSSPGGLEVGFPTAWFQPQHNLCSLCNHVCGTDLRSLRCVLSTTGRSSMDWHEFRDWSHKAAEWGADYRAGLREQSVRAKTAPGDIAAAIAASPPERAEPMAEIFADFE